VGWWILPAVVLVAGAIATLRRAKELIADSEDAARLASPPIGELNESARLAADRMSDIGAVVQHPVGLLRSARRRPWRDLRRRWSSRRGDDPPPS
jgi:hypothetical protein